MHPLARISYFGLVLTGIAASGCNLFSGPDLLGFERLNNVLVPASPPLSSSGSSVIIHSSFATPCEPYDATAEVSSFGRLLTLHVRGKATGPCPSDVIDSFVYRATIGSLSSGNYTVRVIHSYADANWPSESLTLGTITVP